MKESEEISRNLNPDNEIEDNIKLQITEYESFEGGDPSTRFVEKHDLIHEGHYKSLEILFNNIDKSSSILEVGCGDGVSLEWLIHKGYTNIEGSDVNPRKLEIASRLNIHLYEEDMHQLSNTINKQYDVIYSAHTLEHAYKPDIALEEIKKLLKPKGLLLVVLPLPDRGPWDAHCGSKYLKLDTGNAEKVLNVFEKHGFSEELHQIAKFRQDEIILKFKKK